MLFFFFFASTGTNGSALRLEGLVRKKKSGFQSVSSTSTNIEATNNSRCGFLLSSLFLLSLYLTSN